MRTPKIIFCLMAELALSAVALAEEPIQEFLDLQASLHEMQREAEALEKTAHADLDAERYEDAVASHREARRLLVEAEAMETRLTERLVTIVAGLIDELGNESFARRREASLFLARLGPRALPRIHESLRAPDLDPEVRHRLREVLKVADVVRVDEKGRFRQWAVGSKASTEYTNSAWSAMQASGKPDTDEAGDHETAWAPKGTNIGMQWLEVSYAHAVVPVQVRVHETYNPGTVVKVEARDEEGKLHMLWEGKDSTKKAPDFFEIEIEVPEDAEKRIRTKAVRLTLDTDVVDGYNEIDAVELVGMP